MTRLLGLALGVALCGCAAAPPARVTHGGAPGRLGPNQGEVSLAGGYAILPLGYVSAGGSVPLARWLRLDAGADTSFGGGGLGHLVGRLGLRVTPVQRARFERGPRDDDEEWIGDVEIGVATGAGGEDCVPMDDPACDVPSLARVAGAGYLGGGVAYWDGDHAFFMRARAQVGGASLAPTTLWGSAILGGDFALADIVRLDVGLGGWFYANSDFSVGHALAELGVTVLLGSAEVEPE